MSFLMSERSQGSPPNHYHLCTNRMYQSQLFYWGMHQVQFASESVFSLCRLWTNSSRCALPAGGLYVCRSNSFHGGSWTMNSDLFDFWMDHLTIWSFPLMVAEFSYFRIGRQYPIRIIHWSYIRIYRTFFRLFNP